MKRLAWLDLARGLAILLVVYFHFFMTYIDGRAEPSWHAQTMTGSIAALAEVSWLKLSGLGFHAVGLFIALSRWALMESTSRRAAKSPIEWGPWYVRVWSGSISCIGWRIWAICFRPLARDWSRWTAALSSVWSGFVSSMSAATSTT